MWCCMAKCSDDDQMKENEVVVHVASLRDEMHYIFLSENLREGDNLSTGMRMSVWYSGRLLCEQQ